MELPVANAPPVAILGTAAVSPLHVKVPIAASLTGAFPFTNEAVEDPAPV